MAVEVIPFLERFEWLTLLMSSDYMNYFSENKFVKMLKK